MSETPGTGRAGRSTPLVLAAAFLGAAAASAFALSGVPRGAFGATLAAGGLLTLAGVKARDPGSPRLRFADAVTDRAVDALVLGAAAWSALPGEPGRAAAAVAALALSNVASYLRARAAGLGFRVDEPLYARPGRLSFVAIGVLEGPEAQGALWVAAAVSLLGIVAGAAAVSRQRERA